MLFYSTNRKATPVNFREATILGQAPDKGLYFPSTVPEVDPALIAQITSIADEDICFEVIKPYIGELIDERSLKRIVEETINFSIPLVRINDRIASLELFHGPTLAFKDIGARFMSRCLGYFLEDESRKVTVLVATSGDTGSAVANGFHNIPNVDVVILYPSGKVSRVQEQQLTTLGDNIHAIEVQGTFDDCQQLVKQVFATAEDLPDLMLTSANSINVARWLPQQFYYFLAYKQWADKDHPPVICVPSGNFGNICAGMLANVAGLPVTHFIAACNSNDVIPHFLAHEEYLEKKAIPTISNAMDVAAPSNFVRILELFHREIDELRSRLSAESISDEKTKATIKTVLHQYNYILDPHGAVGYAALESYLEQYPMEKGLIIETAHPVKFYDVVEPLIGEKVAIPANILEQLSKPKQATLIKNDIDELKEYLRNI